MTHDPTTVARDVYERWGRGDFGSVDWAHDDVELVLADGTEAGARRGLAALSRTWGEWLREWRDFRVEADEFVAIDDESVLVLTRFHGSGKRSAIAMEARPGASLLTVRGGRVVRLVLYTDREAALEDMRRWTG
jgi:ketosteroid isomerase-like protein